MFVILRENSRNIKVYIFAIFREAEAKRPP